MQHDTKMRLLIVDDEPCALKYLSLFLVDHADIITCDGADAAVRNLEEHAEHLDAIISDDRMPIVSGGDLLALAAERWPRLPRILTTAYSDIDRLRALIADGIVDRVIFKPWDDTALLESICVTIELVSNGRHAPTGQAADGPIFPVTQLNLDQLADLPARVVLELEQALALDVPLIELAPCSVQQCLDEAFSHLPADAEVSITGHDAMHLVVTNASCLGGALAYLMGNSLLAARESPQAKVQLQIASTSTHITLTISDTADWGREGLVSLLFPNDLKPDDPRAGISLLLTALIIRGCRGEIDITLDPTGHPTTTLRLARLIH